MASQGRVPGEGADSYDAASILGNGRARRILSVLLEHSRPVPTRELSVQVAAREAAVRPAEISETTRDSIRTALVHRYLPKLQEVGWVDQHPAGLTATVTALTPTDGLSVPSLHEPDHPHWDPVSALLSRPYRIVLVALLADRQAPLSLPQLASHLREHQHLSWVSPLPDEQQLRTRLYHADVPKLANVDLVTFDTAAQTATHTALASDIIDQPASILE